MIELLKNLGMSGMIPLNKMLESLKKDFESDISQLANKPVVLNKFNLIYSKKTDTTTPYNWFIQRWEEQIINGKAGLMEYKHPYNDGQRLFAAIEVLLSEHGINSDNIDIAALRHDNSKWSYFVGYTINGESKSINHEI